MYVKHQDSTTFIYNGKPIEETEAYKYVGTVFTNKRKRFHDDHDLKSEKALKAIFVSKKSVHDAVGNSLPVNLYLKIFDTQIRPIRN